MDTVYRFKAALKYRKGLWRRIEIKGSQTLYKLDRILREVFHHDLSDQRRPPTAEGGRRQGGVRVRQEPMKPVTGLLYLMLVAGTVSLGAAGLAVADHADMDWIEGIVIQVDPRTQTLELADSRGRGLAICRLRVPSATLLRDIKPGDRVRARLLDRSHVLSLEKLPPPSGDDQYWDEVRRLIGTRQVGARPELKGTSREGSD